MAACERFRGPGSNTGGGCAHPTAPNTSSSDNPAPGCGAPRGRQAVLPSRAQTKSFLPAPNTHLPHDATRQAQSEANSNLPNQVEAPRVDRALGNEHWLGIDGLGSGGCRPRGHVCLLSATHAAAAHPRRSRLQEEGEMGLKRQGLCRRLPRGTCVGVCCRSEPHTPLF